MLATVQKLHVNNVYSDFNSFIKQYDSERTKSEYKRDIGEFFQYLHGVELSDLTRDHVIYASLGTMEKLNKKHVIAFRSHLLEKNSANTVNRKIMSLKAFYKFLQGDDYPVNNMIFSLKTLKHKVDSYDVPTKTEVDMMAELALQMKYGKELHACIYALTVTSIRVSALLECTWSQSVKKVDDTRFYVIEAMDKNGDVAKMPIEQWLYDKLLACKVSDKLFENLTLSIVNKAVKKLAAQAGIEGKRIVTHSLRKVAPTFEMKTTHDVRLGMKQTRHKSVQVFMENYVDKSAEYNQLAGIKMFSELDEGVLERESKESILDTLKEINREAYDQLVLKLMDKYQG